MKNIIATFIIVLGLVWANNAEAGMTRIYHLGKPNGKPPSSLMTQAMGGVGAISATPNDRVWEAKDDAASSPYSRYNLMASRLNVSDYIRSGRGSPRGLTGITQSVMDNDLFFPNHYRY